MKIPGERKGAIAHHGKPLWKRIISCWELYLLLIPGIVLTIIYKYIPMYGVQIAFRDYNPTLGFSGSPWVGLKWFTKFFTNYKSMEMIKNTLLLSLYTILWTFPIPIIFSLLMNQLRFKRFKKLAQTILYAPHFVSIMIVCGMLRIFLSPYGGLITMIASAFGADTSIGLLDQPGNFRSIYIASAIWQDAGWGMIIYMASLSSVDASLHEAAKVDGANTWKRIIHIDLPALVPMIMINLIMSFGNLMNVGFEKAFLLQTDLNTATSEIIATYVYEQGMLKSMYSFSTAVGLFNTAVNILLLIVVNKIAKKTADISFI
ncbi:MAG: ABC transporter permease subunit [Lachnospiraceae bacterium]|nr:ABC transporter permease subunit [Lachnospiraceae bacterium]